MKLNAIIVCNQAKPLDYFIDPDFISYFQDMDLKQRLIDLEEYHILIETKKESDIFRTLESWKNESRVMSHEQLKIFNEYFKGLIIKDSTLKLVEDFNEAFSKEFYQSLEDHISISFPMPSNGMSIFFKEAYDVTLKNAIYIDNYGSFCISFNSAKTKKNDELCSIAIYEEKNEKKISIPKIDSTNLILHLFEKKMGNHNIDLIRRGKIFKDKELKSLVCELMKTDLEFKGYGLNKVGIYGHVHNNSKKNAQMNFIQEDIDSFDISQLDMLASTEKHFFDGKICEIVPDNFVKFLNNNDLDLFMQQIRMLHDSLFQGTCKAYKTPERTFIAHFIKDCKNYAIIEKSRLITFDKGKSNEESHYNRFGAVCLLENSGKSLQEVIKFCEKNINSFEKKTKHAITRALF